MEKEVDSSPTRIDVMSEQIRRDSERRTQSLISDFTSVVTDTKKKFPEEMFRKYYVTFFSGIKSEHDNMLLNNWYAIAGSPFDEVDLVDGAGRIVATVPPVLNRDIIPIVTARQPGISVDFAMETARQQSSLSPRMAQTRLTTSLNEKFIKPDESTTKTVQERWTALMKRYARDLPVTAKPMIGTASTESDFDYD